ncbi:uncharacterized protein LOC115633279 [Scaptodrosophila lebanonensis]|uniref:Uncharacterized protein LOC115633279 n=1 Tax=Drosophila lebanonensis TaxID=7225 RepID=A0A6J2UEG7_DROLE|nr:uncharacterized protein LOC115633279 [Scaptodrosophila lebanonensis]
MKVLYVLVVFAVACVAYVSCGSCVQCNSSSDERCATDPTKYLAKECTGNTTGCYMRVLNGVTIRGCLNELDNATQAKCTNEMECLKCTFTEYCNNQVFPTHRPSCLQCSGNSTSSTCARYVLTQPTICPLYQLGDKCFIRNTNKTNVDGSFQRGCLSSAKAQKLCLKEENCYLCEGAGCNFLRANDTQIPLARDGAFSIVSSMALLLACMLFGRAF